MAAKKSDIPEVVETVEVVQSVEAVETVEAFVLRDCGFGNSGEVVSLPSADAKVGAAHGMLDLHADAINAAKTANKAA